MIQWLGITLFDVGHARALLTAWTNAQGNPKPVPSYGLLFPSLAWTQQDGIVLHAFAVWWNGAGYSPKLPVGQSVGGVLQAELTDAHLAALDKWAAGAVPLPLVVDVPASKALLVLWGRTDGQGLVQADYGMQASDLPLSPWTERDGQALMTFGKWSMPPISGSTFTTEYAIALKAWFAGKAAQVPAGFQPPVQVTPPAQKTPQPLQVLPPPPAPGPGPVVKPPAETTKSEGLPWWIWAGGAAALGLLGLVVLRTANPGAGPPAPSGPQENPRRASGFKFLVGWEDKSFRGFGSLHVYQSSSGRWLVSTKIPAEAGAGSGIRARASARKAIKYRAASRNVAIAWAQEHAGNVDLWERVGKRVDKFGLRTNPEGNPKRT